MTQTSAAAATFAPVVAQILDPAPGSKLWAGDTLAVRIRVDGAAEAGLLWSLTLRQSGLGQSTVLATGTGAVRDGVVAELATAALLPGEQYALELFATTANGTVTAAGAFQISDPVYTFIPFEEGNLSRSQEATYAGDASGNRLLFAGRYGDPAELILLDRRAGHRERLLVRTGSNEGVKLSGDGSRLFFYGSFRTPIDTYRWGVSFLDLQTRAFSLVAPDGDTLYSTDGTGRRVVYQGLTPDRVSQYFLYDEQTGETLQLTDDPKAIIHSVDPTFCPRILGTTPLITRDGSLVILITSAALGVVPEDASVGCLIFSFDVATRSLKHVASLPRSRDLDVPAISGDGRWLSFSVSRDLPNGIRRAFPALLDLRTGELLDPVVDVGDFTSFDSVITSDGQGVVISTQADLDPRVGNADHNMELFYYDLAGGTFTQISETTGGIGRHPGGCPSYRPFVNDDAAVLILGGFHRFSVERCVLDAPQRNERDGFWFRLVRAVRKRPGNRGPVLDRVDDLRVTAGDTLTLTFTAQDPDGDPISFFAQVKDGFDVPPGAEITDHHDGTATFTWPTRLEHAGTHVLRVAAFDEGGGEVFQDVTISVVPRGPDESPTAEITPDETPTPTITFTPVPTLPSPPAEVCPGDCNGDETVTVAELITGVNLALGTIPLATCSAFDCRGAHQVTIDCLTKAVRAALEGCAPG